MYPCSENHHSWSAYFIVITLSTWLRNWTCNMCSMINWSIFIKNNILYCNYVSIWTVLPDIIIEHHQLVISFNDSLYQEVGYRCILYIGIIYQARITVVTNLHNKCTKPSKCTLSVFYEKNPTCVLKNVNPIL